MVRIELVRSGGFAGLRLRSTVDTATEPDPTWYDDQLAGLDLAALAAPSGEPSTSASLPAPDRFHYALSVDPGDGSAGHRLEFAETDVPDALAPLVERLESRGSRGERSPGVVETSD